MDPSVPPQPQSGRPARIVILGGGFAGAYCARELERRLGAAAAEILLIDRQNYFVFYPLLVEAGTGSLEPRHAVVSIRSFLKRARFRMAEIAGLDAGTGNVIIADPDTGRREEVGYDHLVVALGSVTMLPPVPGLMEFGFQMKGTADAIAIRDRVIRMLELAEASGDPARKRELLGFVVVGANFTGAETAGELDAFLRRALREYELLSREDASITLIDRGPRILPVLDPALSHYAQRAMERRGIRVALNQTVSAIDGRSATLSDGEVIPAETVIWAAGIAPPPALAGMGLPRDERGYIVCDRDLRVRGSSNVWAIGDCAANPDSSGAAYPATAQHAVRQGRWAARNIARALRGESALPCDITSMGSLAALGCRTGVASVFGVKIAGFPAWWLWRTVYLMKMPGLGRKLRVALDWTLDLFFRNDPVQLGVHRVRRTAPSVEARNSREVNDVTPQ